MPGGIEAGEDVGELVLAVVQKPVELGVHGLYVVLVIDRCSIAFTAGQATLGVTPIRFVD